MLQDKGDILYLMKSISIIAAILLLVVIAGLGITAILEGISFDVFKEFALKALGLIAILYVLGMAIAALTGKRN